MKIKGKFARSLFIMLPLIVALTLVIGGCGSKGEPTTGQEVKVKVGLSIGFTGPMASGSAPMGEGMLSYVKYVNDQGGIEYIDPATRKTQKALLDIHWEDNAYDASKRLAIFKRQADWGMDLQLLTAGPDDTAQAATQAGVPILSISQISGAVLNIQPCFVTGTFVSYTEQNAAFIKWASQQQATPPRIALISYDNQAFRFQLNGAGLTEEFCKAYGGELAGVEWVPMTITDFTIQLTRLKATNPDWIIMQVVPSHIAMVIKDAQRIGMPSAVKYCGTSSTFDEGIVGLLGAQSEGVYAMIAWAFPSQTSIPGVQLADQIVRTYYNRAPTTDHMQGITCAVIGVEGIRQALNKVGAANLTPSAVNDALHNLTNFDPMGLTQPVTVTVAYPAASKSIHVGVIQGGVVKVVSDWLPCPRLVGQ